MLAELVRKIASRHSKTARDFRLGAIGNFQHTLNQRFFQRRQKVSKIVRLGHQRGELVDREISEAAGRDATHPARRGYREILRCYFL
jgi:hypothetical protein